MQSHTPNPIRAVPNRAYPTRVSSPRSIPKTAVAAKVVALVTGTASDIGASLRMAKKVAEAVRLTKKGTVYCQIERSLSHRRKEERSLFEERVALEEDLRAWSQRRAPRRISALVAPHAIPIATIFSTSPIIFFRSLSVQLFQLILFSLFWTKAQVKWCHFLLSWSYLHASQNCECAKWTNSYSTYLWPPRMILLLQAREQSQRDISFLEALKLRSSSFQEILRD